MSTRRLGTRVPASVAILVVMLTSGLARGQSRGKKPAEVEAELQAQIERLRGEIDARISAEGAAAVSREEALRKEHNAAVEGVREELEKRMAAERIEQQAEVLRLRKALAEASSREDEREKRLPPSVGVSGPGVSVDGYVQGDIETRQDSEDQLDGGGTPLNLDRVLVRRARLGVTVDKGYGGARLEIDGNTVNGPAFRLLGAEASFKWPSTSVTRIPIVMATVGSFRIPFGREVAQDDRERLFMERTTVAKALFPGEFDLGLRLAGAWQFVRYSLAVQNGQPLGGQAFPGLDPNAAKDVIGRIGVAQSLARLDVAGGVSGLRGRGFHAGALATKPSLQWNDANEDGVVGEGEVTGVAGTAASPSSSFTRIAFGADLAVAVRWSPMLTSRFEGELYLANNLDRTLMAADPNGPVGRDLRELGYYFAVVQEYGRWRLGARYDYYDPDQDANKNARGNPVPIDSSYSTLAIVVGCTSAWGRLLVEYDRNRNHLGLAATGMPANLDSDAFIVRGEVGF